MCICTYIRTYIYNTYVCSFKIYYIRTYALYVHIHMYHYQIYLYNKREKVTDVFKNVTENNNISI